LPDIREQLHRLGHLGIQVHAQVVLVPGLNDLHLQRTVSSLVGFFPTVQSIGVVPVGLTRYHRAGLRGVTPQEAKALVKQVSLWSGEFRERYGCSLVYLADEFYLLAGLLPPPAEEYDGFPQLENGIGLVRRLLDEAINKPSAAKAKKSLVCGTLIAPLLEEMAKEFSLQDPVGGALLSTQIEVIPIENRFFGPTITVSGLLTGQDVIEALSGRHLGEPLYLPRSMFDARGEITLDGMTVEDMEAVLGVKVTMAETMSEVLAY
jgi:putative radical SAM enzyme (TIGR03279 family)